ncbi:hypothetical protein GCM10010411_58520 [Actinomadura fulvescens]|uniref:Uncharacterized protein n=1 Tax=Actinomadura fulvescens TaxID=46160 RepID=A0ABP6CDU5_9ACTN
MAANASESSRWACMDVWLISQVGSPINREGVSSVMRGSLVGLLVAPTISARERETAPAGSAGAASVDL